MIKRLDISKCLPFDTLLIILLVLVSVVYLIDFMNNKYVDDKYESIETEEKAKKNKKDNVEKFTEGTGAGELSADEIEHQRIIDLITTAYDSYQNAKATHDTNNANLNQATLAYNEAVANGSDQATLTELSDQKNTASAAIYISLRNLNDTTDRLLNLKAQYPDEYSLIVFGSAAEELESEDAPPQTQQPPIVHNHYNQYYGGNPELTEFLQQLTNQLTENRQQGDLSLMDQGMCSELNNKLSTMTLAEFKNNRFVQDLKSRCENSQGVDCSFRPTNSQTALLGTLLEDAEQTRVGDILPKDEISTDY